MGMDGDCRATSLARFNNDNLVFVAEEKVKSKVEPS